MSARLRAAGAVLQDARSSGNILSDQLGMTLGTSCEVSTEIPAKPHLLRQATEDSPSTFLLAPTFPVFV